nr:hypothetical protein [Tanacetum cinerariifolium]
MKFAYCAFLEFKGCWLLRYDGPLA